MDDFKNKVSGEYTVSGRTISQEENRLNLDVKGTLPSSGSLVFDEKGTIVEVKDLIVNGYKFNYKNGTWSGEKDDTPVAPPKDEVKPEISVTAETEGEEEWKTLVTVKATVTKKGTSEVTMYYCITDSNCIPSSEGNSFDIKQEEYNVSLSDNENARKVCFEGVNGDGVHSEITCSELYKVDGESPDVTPPTTTPEITQGTDKATSSYFTFKWGVSGTGNISCTPENVKTLSVGDNKEISCTAIGKNGKETTKTSTIKVKSAEPITPSLSTHFGAYVNYTPTDATWESSKLTSYGVLETTQSGQGKFDIYDLGTNASARGKSKSQSITCTDSSYKNKYNGWRVLDVSGEVITLIHAGTPECYYHANGQSSRSVSILETASTSSSPGDSKAWTKYGNATYAQSVHYMTNEDFNKITYQINKNSNYTIDDYDYNDSSCFYKKNSTQCGYNHDMIDIGSFYWLASAYSDYNLYYWDPDGRSVGGNFDYSRGVRPVVVLKSGIKFKDDGKDGKSESTAFNLVAP